MNEQVTRKGEWASLPRNHRKRKPDPRETMLRDFLNAKTAHEKREVIKSFAPHYFVFGNQLDPRNPYEQGENHESV